MHKTMKSITNEFLITHTTEFTIIEIIIKTTLVVKHIMNIQILIPVTTSTKIVNKKSNSKNIIGSS